MTARRRTWHRRDWLRTALAAVAAGPTVLAAPRPAADPFEQILARARDARMQPFESTEAEHFRAIGDASARHRQEALDLAEAFAADYLAHFRARGFALAWPATRLPVVVLAGPTSYAAFEKDFVDETVGGHFDLANNWLVTFDFRTLGPTARAAGAADPRLDNTLSLVHETFHQLSYNTGLLDRRAPLLLCITEGLAEYAETWRPGRKEVIGAINRRRQLGLQLALKARQPWIPVRDLLAKDELQDGEQTAQGARGESWLLAYRLLKDAARLVQFRAYLQAVRAATDPADRVALATQHFGDLDKLDREIRRS